MIRICGVVRESIVDGPGLRFVLFTQGCPHHCPGCHNPESHPMDGGSLVEPQRVVEEMKKNPLLKGLTLSGGEPTLQCGALLPLVRAMAPMHKDIVLYTGYTYEELMARCKTEPELKELLGLCQILIDGKYHQEERDLTLIFRGSRNQRVLDVPATLACGEPVLAMEYYPTEDYH